jgi:hypothetical protein
MTPANEAWKRLLAAAELLAGKMPSTRSLDHFHARKEVIKLREAIEAVKKSSGRVPPDHEFDENGNCLWCPAHSTSEGENCER